MPILLFDIDGTLIRSGGAGKAAMEAGVRNAFGLNEFRDTVEYSGRTDTAIGGDLLRENGVEVSPANVQKLRRAYLDALPGCLRALGGSVCVGIPGLLADLGSRPDVLLGLITGNVREGARIKLGHFGLWDHFALGGFGDDHIDRDQVARDTFTLVETHLGRKASRDDVWVIGDTPHDVRCARAIGARAVAVATGWHTLDELQATKADHVFADFRDHAAFLSLLS